MIRVSRRRLATGIALMAVGAEVALGGPYILGLLRKVDHVKPLWLATAIGAELISMEALARLQRRMLQASGTHTLLGRMIRTTYAAYFLNTAMPGGIVVSNLWMINQLKRFGASVTGATFAAAATLVMTLGTFAGMGVLAAALHNPQSWTTLGAVLAAGALVVVTVVLARRSVLARLVERVVTRTLHIWNRVLRRPSEDGHAAVTSFVCDLRAFRPRSRDWVIASGSAWTTWIADFVCLIASARAVGANDLSLATLSSAWLAGAGATNLTILPGGLGVVDAAMILTLSAGTTSPGTAAATAVLYRLVSFAMVALIGLVAWAGASWRAAAENRRAIAVAIEGYG
jgi:hypothetical protein